MLPLFFQVVLLDTPSKAGIRLIIPSLATPVGGVIAGYTMSRGGRLGWLVRCGTALLTLGNVLVASLRFKDAYWKYILFLLPANLGLGMTYPSTLFTFVGHFEHRGSCSFGAKNAHELMSSCRASCSHLPGLSHQIFGEYLWSNNHIGDCTKRFGVSAARGVAWHKA